MNESDPNKGKAMNETDPYSTPESELTKEKVFADFASEAELAGRGERLIAAIVDGIISAVITFGLIFAFGIWDDLFSGRDPELGTLLIVVVLSFVTYFGVNWYYLENFGQTIGKRLLSIRICDLQGRNPGALKIIFVRYLPMQVIAQIPLVGGLIALVNVLMIFGSERRCLHDHIAGTMVVSASE